jgi:hypothetical protein
LPNAVIQLERGDRTETVHLRLGQLVLWVAGQTGSCRYVVWSESFLAERVLSNWQRERLPDD